MVAFASRIGINLQRAIRRTATEAGLRPCAPTERLVLLKQRFDSVHKGHSVKKKATLALCAIVIVLAVCIWIRWKHDEPRRKSLETLRAFQFALESQQVEVVLERLVLPQALKLRTPPEQFEFLSKVMHEEISTDGLNALRSKAQFGPLLELFPLEAAVWASQAGVRPQDCVAFKATQSGIDTEVVLHVHEKACRIVRCNNVKQLAVASKP